MSRLRIRALLAAAVTLVVVVGGAGPSTALRAPATVTVVPELRGLEYPEASGRAAAAAGLKVCGDHSLGGIVVDQTPLPGQDAVGVDCIVVTVADAVLVPNLLGASVNGARDALQAVKLVLTDPGTTTGTVASQNPVADTLVAVGSAVSVTMTKPISTVPTPNLVGRTVGEAEALVLPVGLRLRNAGSDRSRRIATQKPAPGTQVLRGSRVSVTLEPLVVLVTVPNLQGMTLDLARAAVANVHLVLANPGSTNPGNDAHVATQTPPAGTKVKQGSQVTVTLELIAAPVDSHTRLEGAGGALALLALLLAAIGGLTRKRRRRARGSDPEEFIDPAEVAQPRPPLVHLVARPDPALAVRLLSTHDLLHARLGLEAHGDPTIDPDLVEVSP